MQGDDVLGSPRVGPTCNVWDWSGGDEQSFGGGVTV
jgi:hypothetical protein